MKPFLDPRAEARAVAVLRDRLGAYILDEDENDLTLLLDTIEGETSFFEAVDEMLAQVAVNAAKAEGVGRAIQRFEERRRRYAQRVESARAILGAALDASGLKKVECAHGTVALRTGTPKVEVISEELIPDAYWKTPPRVLDRVRLAADLKADIDIPGATLSNGAPSLTIRVA